MSATIANFQLPARLPNRRLFVIIDRRRWSSGKHFSRAGPNPHQMIKSYSWVQRWTQWWTMGWWQPRGERFDHRQHVLAPVASLVPLAGYQQTKKTDLPVMVDPALANGLVMVIWCSPCSPVWIMIMVNTWLWLNDGCQYWSRTTTNHTKNTPQGRIIAITLCPFSCDHCSISSAKCWYLSVSGTASQEAKSACHQWLRQGDRPTISTRQRWIMWVNSA